MLMIAELRPVPKFINILSKIGDLSMLKRSEYVVMSLSFVFMLAIFLVISMTSISSIRRHISPTRKSSTRIISSLREMIRQSVKTLS